MRYIYLAARFSRRPELLRYAADLAGRGHIVTSRWLQGGHRITDDGLSAEATLELRSRFACEDWADLRRADVCIAFTEVPRTSNSRGGRHVELGAALAWQKLVVVCGPAEHVFCCLPAVMRFETWEDLLTSDVLSAKRPTVITA